MYLAEIPCPFLADFIFEYSVLPHLFQLVCAHHAALFLSLPYSSDTDLAEPVSTLAIAITIPDLQIHDKRPCLVS